MKACVLKKIGEMSYETVADPVLNPQEVLLRIGACGICSSDVDRVYRTGTYHFPTIPGHEFAGEIVAVGEGCEHSLLGKRAAVFPLLPCFSCPSCEEEAYGRCENYRYFGSRNDGGFGEYLAVPLWNLVFFSQSVPFAQAALCEPMAVARHALGQGGDCTGKTVAVIGNGTIGLLAGLWAKKMGASQVVMVGRGEKKVDFGKTLGFSHSISSQKEDVPTYIRQCTGGQGADVVLEMVGSSASVELSISSCKKGGTVVLTGNPHGDMTLSRDIYWKILRQELTLKGSWNSSYQKEQNNWKESIAVMEEGTFPLDSLITHQFPLAQWEKGFQVMTEGKETVVKVILVPEGETIS